jgi:hypothetical protein
MNFFQGMIFSSAALALTAVVYLILGWVYQPWNHKGVIQHDAVSYYSYLPSVFIYRDLNLDYIDKPENSEARERLMFKLTADGQRYLKMTMGVAVLQLPFFLAAHGYSHATGKSTSGFSPAYELGIWIAAFFYCLAGLMLLAAVIRFFYSDIIAAFIVISAGLATNLLVYTVYQPGMSHAYSFFLCNAFIYLTVCWHRQPSAPISFWLGLVFGMMVLIRPTNGLIAVFFILWNITDRPSFVKKLLILRKNLKHLSVAFIPAMVVLIPQLLYWQHISGRLFFYSYEGESFYFQNPHIVEGLFGFRKGFFVYAPVMLLMLPGFYFSFKSRMPFAWPALLFFLLNVYVVFSWWCWWYGGGFGSRPLVDSLGISLLPVATCVDRLWKYSRWLRVAWLTFLIACSTLIIFQLKQFHLNLLHFDSMNFKLYCRIFGTLRFPSDFELLLTPPDNENAKKNLPPRPLFLLSPNKLKLLYQTEIQIENNFGESVVIDETDKQLLFLSNERSSANRNFILRMYQGDYFTLQTPEGYFVQLAEMKDGAVLKANAILAGHNAVFRLNKKEHNQFEIISSYGTVVGRLMEGDLSILATGYNLPVRPVTFRFHFVKDPALEEK